MSEEVKTPTAADIARGITEGVLHSEIVKDAAQPAAKSFGTAIVPAGAALGQGLTTVAQTLNLCLEPLRGLIWGYDRIKEEVFPILADRFAGKLRRMVSPDILVAGPTIEALRFTGHNPTLRGMFINLLATSMDAETAQAAHPAFVEIIKQMSAEEARFLTALVGGWSTRATKDMRFFGSSKNGPYHFLRSMVDDGVVKNTEMIGSYLDNFQRLRFLTIPVSATTNAAVHPSTHYFIDIPLTAFGIQFCRACVWEPAPVVPAGSR